MRGTITAAAAGWLLTCTFAFAQVSKPPATAECAATPEMLGVSRVVEIDTADGPRLGQMQYPDHDFLKEGEVVLTFDDGPLRRYTFPVLEALDTQCAKATFFVVGRMAVADPEALKEVARRGHTIGTHTWSHRNLRASKAATAEQEIELGISAASLALGHAVAPFFRFPYLADSKNALDHFKARGIAAFSIDIDTKDFRTRSAQQVRRRVLAGLEEKKKGIILFHDIQASTARAMKDLLVELKTHGYKIVHVVPKQPATTLAEYDAIAGRELARKTIAASQPLATRSLVWPNSPEADEPRPPVRKKRSRSRPAHDKGAGTPSEPGASATGPPGSEALTDLHLNVMRR